MMTLLLFKGKECPLFICLYFPLGVYEGDSGVLADIEGLQQDLWIPGFILLAWGL